MRSTAQRVLILQPTEDVFSVDALRFHLRIDDTDQDDYLKLLRAAAVNQIDPAGGGWLGRALRPQTWELQLGGFQDCIELPYPPFIEIVSFKYDDAVGVEQPLVKDTDFRIVQVRNRAALMPLYGKSWPTARCDHGSVRIRYRCGYPTGNAADPMPPVISAWLKLIIGTLYANRESVTEKSRLELPAHVLSMIEGQRVYF